MVGIRTLVGGLALVAAGCGGQAATVTVREAAHHASAHHAAVRHAARRPARRVVIVTRTVSQPIDCQNDGARNGIWIGADNNGAGGCAYSFNVYTYCQHLALSYEVISPPGTFLVGAGYEGSGLMFFRWSDGTETQQVRVC